LPIEGWKVFARQFASKRIASEFHHHPWRIGWNQCEEPGEQIKAHRGGHYRAGFHVLLSIGDAEAWAGPGQIIRHVWIDPSTITAVGSQDGGSKIVKVAVAQAVYLPHRNADARPELPKLKEAKKKKR
jgi:hypothetical protein